MTRRSNDKILYDLRLTYNHWECYPYFHHKKGRLWTAVRHYYIQQAGDDGVPLEYYHDFTSLRNLETFLKKHNHPYKEGAI